MNTLTTRADAVSVAHSLSSPLNTVVTFGAIALLFFGVLAFGAVEYWSLFIMRCGAALLLLLWAAGQAAHPASCFVRNPLFLPMALWAILVAAQYASRLTAYCYATFSEAMNFTAYGILTFLAVQCFQSERALKQLGITFSSFGAVLACFAMVQEVTSQGRLYWVRVPQHGGSIYGPYVNHNHYAGLMEMLVPISLALCLSTAVGRTTRMLTGFSALLMAVSLFLCGSRGGMVAFLAELLFLGVLQAVTERKSRHKGWRNLTIVCGLLVVLLLCMGAGQVWNRARDLGHAYNDEVAGGRWTIAHDSLRMWAQRPLLGWGLGTFPSVFPQFRSFHSDRITNQAHNDVLQIGVETGAIGFALMLTFCVLLYRQGLRRSALHGSISSAVTLGALAGCTGLIVHSLADFNLHVLANAALFFFLCGIAAGRRSIPPRGSSICSAGSIATNHRQRTATDMPR